MLHTLISSAARRVLVVALAAGALAGCGSDDDKKSPFKLPTSVARFVPDGDPVDGSLFLRQVSLDSDSLVLEIATQGTAPLYGVALRLETEAGVLDLGELLPATPFAGGVARGAQPRPGLMAITYSRVGDQAAVDDDVIGSFRLSRSMTSSAPVRFIETESFLFDADAKPIDGVTFVGGELVVP
jgi:hypothetical protein